MEDQEYRDYAAVKMVQTLMQTRQVNQGGAAQRNPAALHSLVVEAFELANIIVQVRDIKNSEAVAAQKKREEAAKAVVKTEPAKLVLDGEVSGESVSEVESKPAAENAEQSVGLVDN